MRKTTCKLLLIPLFLLSSCREDKVLPDQIMTCTLPSGKEEIWKTKDGYDIWITRAGSIVRFKNYGPYIVEYSHAVPCIIRNA